MLVALQESFVELEPDRARAAARRQRAGARHAARRLSCGPRRSSPRPTARCSAASLIGGDPVRFGGTFRCGPQKGRYQIEVTGEDRFGATVVANFPRVVRRDGADDGWRRQLRAAPARTRRSRRGGGRAGGVEAAQRRSRARRPAAAWRGTASSRRSRAATRPTCRRTASSGTSRRRPARPPIARARRGSTPC